ncbi:3-epi-6-deoxocathasterone 23-monooxygenase [Nymphaea thermarum]|nr:3-epi-6-deoxocathasterone 23-monooxygenase [Nymphaea thermarum]
MKWLLGIAVLVVVASSWWWYCRSRRRRKERKVPKGRLGWPIIGETLDYILHGYSSRPEDFMMKRRALYGKVFKTNILGSPTIVSTDVEVNKAILQNDGKTFVPFYPKTVTELLGKSSILQMNGSLQRKVHGLIGGFFKSPALKAQITRDMDGYVRRAMRRWTDGQTVRIQDETKSITFRVLVKALMSVEGKEEVEELRKDFKEFTAGLMCLPLNLPFTTLHKSLQAKKRMVGVVDKVIKEKMGKGSGEVVDAIDALLKEVTSHSGGAGGGGGGEEGEERLSPEFLSENIVEMMIPGEDSVPILMSLAIKYLSDCPSALQLLREENMEMKKEKSERGEALSWNDYLSLPFTQNVISETLRMGNIINGVMRKALNDVEIKGYLIPKGWRVLASFRSVHLDEESYDSPYRFDPWRWQRRESSGCIHFTPFGGGHRLCPGLDLSRLETSIFLHHFTTSFSWVAEDDEIINFPTVRMKRGLPVIVKPILNLSSVDQSLVDL